MKTYIGDSVYVDVVDGALKLTTEHGYEVTNTIYLEYEVFLELTRYADQWAAGYPE